MSEISIARQEQTGGWFNVGIFLTEEITSTPTYLTNKNASLVTFEPAEEGLDILPVGENISITEPSRKTKSGTIFSIRAQFDIENQSKSLDEYLNQFRHKDVVFIGIKHSGQQKLYGSKKFPLEFDYEFINGKKYEDGSRIRITVAGKIPQKPVFITD